MNTINNDGPNSLSMYEIDRVKTGLPLLNPLNTMEKTQNIWETHNWQEPEERSWLDAITGEHPSNTISGGAIGQWVLKK